MQSVFIYFAGKDTFTISQEKIREIPIQDRHAEGLKPQFSKSCSQLKEVQVLQTRWINLIGFEFIIPPKEQDC